MRKKAKKYIDDETFADLHAACEDALRYERGEPNRARVTVVTLPAPPKMRSKRQIIKLRKRLNYSRLSFARLLNVSPRTIEAWEQGLREPGDAALKLLAIAEKHPEVFLDSQ